MVIFRLLSEESGLLEQPHSVRQSLIDRLISLPRYLFNAVWYSPMTDDRPVETMIFDHVRHKNIDNRNVDIYTQSLIDKFDREGHDYLVLEQPYDRHHFKTRSPRRKYLDALMVRSYFRQIFMKIRLSAETDDEIARIAQSLNDTFDVEIDWRGLFVRNVKRFRAAYELYRKLLERRRPRRVFLVVNYGRGEMIKAAKDLGMETIELQHGVFDKYHLGYSFPGRTEPLDLFPDKFYVWSEYWRDRIDLPLAKEDIVVYGYPFLEQAKEKYSDVKKVPSQMLVLSQGSVGTKMAGRILEAIERLGKYKLVYKLHPGEYDRWQSYHALGKLLKRENVKLVRDVDLYRLMAESKYQLGVNSTAIFEGIEFGCETVLLDLPGIEYMEDLIRSGKAVMLEEFLER